MRLAGILGICLVAALSMTSFARPMAGGENLGTDLAITACDPVVRTGLPFRCTIAWKPDTEPPGAHRLAVGIIQGGIVLATNELPLERAGQLADGVSLVLFPADPADPVAPVELKAAVLSRDATARTRVAKTLTTPAALAARFAAARKPLAKETELLPLLWIEQGSELASMPVTLGNCERLTAITTKLEQWAAGTRPVVAPETTIETAFRDPVDGSLQPVRLHLPKRDAAKPSPPLWAVLLRDLPDGAVKATWPEAPVAWITAALAQRIAVVEVYPSGDRHWTGVARRRIDLAFDAAQKLWPIPRNYGGMNRIELIVANGPAAAGAVGWLDDHPDCAVLALVDPVLPDPEWTGDALRDWLALGRPGRRIGQFMRTYIGIFGTPDQATRIWMQKSRESRSYVVHHSDQYGGNDMLAGDGKEPGVFTTSPATPAFWNWCMVACDRKSVFKVYGPYERQLGRPGTLGFFDMVDAVVAIEPWGRPARILWEWPEVPEHSSKWSSNGTLLRLDSRSAGFMEEFALVDGAPYRTPPPPPVPSKSFGQATGPLFNYAEAPFTVVVGTAEHAAARADNQALANTFITAWAQHAHGIPPSCTDVDFKPHPKHNLVLIGNERSNRVLAELAERLRDRGLPLPLSWTLREVILRDPAGTRSWLRADRRPLALCWPHPDFDGRLLVILDGAPAWPLAAGWQTGDLPLLELPDLVLGGSEARPQVWALFDSRWRWPGAGR